MKKTSVLSFLAGVILTAAAGYFLVLRPTSQASAMIYATGVEEMANTGIKIHMGQMESHLKNLNRALPELAKAVHSFGENPSTTRALKKIRSYYQVSHQEVPADILPLLPPAELESAKSQRESRSTLSKVGDTLPFRSVTTIEGKEISLSGKVVLLNFFATWCGPCLQELPLLEKDVHRGMASDNLVVVAVGRNHSVEELVKFQKEKGLTLPMVADPDRKLFAAFATEGIPRNILVGKDGSIKFQSMGFVLEDYHAMKKSIQQELKN